MAMTRDEIEACEAEKGGFIRRLGKLDKWGVARLLAHVLWG